MALDDDFDEADWQKELDLVALEEDPAAHESLASTAESDDEDAVVSSSMQALNKLQAQREAQMNMMEADMNDMRHMADIALQSIRERPSTSQLQPPLTQDIFPPPSPLKSRAHTEGGVSEDGEASINRDPSSAEHVDMAIFGLRDLITTISGARSETEAFMESAPPPPPLPSHYEAFSSESTVERKAIYDEYKTQERERGVEREAQRRASMLQAEQEARDRQAALEAAVAESARNRAAQEAAQEKLQAEASRRREEEAAREAERSRRLAALALEMQQRKAEMAAEEQARAARLRAMEREVEDGIVARSKRFLALARILRAWRYYRDGPVRAAKVSAAECFQSAFRAVRARKERWALEARRRVMRRLEEAASKGQIEAAKEALEAAKGVGLGEEVLARVKAMEVQAAEASSRLSAAVASLPDIRQSDQGDGSSPSTTTSTQNSSLASFKSALDAARRFSHLSALVKEAESALGTRREEALAFIRKQVEGGTVQEVAKSIEVATRLGADTILLTSSLNAARQRDAEAIRAVREAAASVPFDLWVFQRLHDRAVQLGLKADAATAKLTVDKRRAAVVAEMRRKADSAAASECQALASMARSLGLESESKGLLLNLEGRQGRLHAELEEAALSGDKNRFESLLVSCHDLGLSRAQGEGSSKVVEAAQKKLLESQERASNQLNEAVANRDLAAYSSAVAAASRAGCRPRDIDQATRLLDEGRRKLALNLSSETQRLTLFGIDLSSFCRLVSSTLGFSSDSSQLPCTSQQLPTEITATLISSSSSSDQSLVSQAAHSLWRLLHSSISAGLRANARLSLLAAFFVSRLQQAAGSVRIVESVVDRDYWGQPLNRSWEDLTPSAASQLISHDPISATAVQRISSSCPSHRGQYQAAYPTYKSTRDLIDRFQSVQSRSPGRSRPPPSTPSPSGSLGEPPGQMPPIAQRRAPARQKLPPHGSSSSSKALNQAMATSSMVSKPSPSGSLPSPRESPLDLSQGETSGSVTLSLDLSLEHLASLSGLDRWCPEVESLVADSNHISQLEGILGLSKLRHLSVKDNYLSSCDILGSLPPNCLESLHIDSNGIEKSLISPQSHRMSSLLGLFHLSASDNEISSISSSPSMGDLSSLAPLLTTLCLRGNLLGSLCGLGACSSLTSLDVSHNSLPNLNGLELCPSLIIMDASYNQINNPNLLPWPSSSASASASSSALPSPLPYQQLTTLSLENNQIVAIQDLPLLPSLTTLSLRDNQITSLCALSLPCPSLRRLDLSFNRLAHLDQVLASLIGVGPALSHLSLSDNPLSSLAPQEAGFREFAPLEVNGTRLIGPHFSAVASSLPWLHELDGELLSLRRNTSTPTSSLGSGHSRSATLALATMRALSSGRVRQLHHVLSLSSEGSGSISHDLSFALHSIASSSSASSHHYSKQAARSISVHQGHREEFIPLQPSYKAVILEKCSLAAVTFQSAWRARQARDLGHHLRSKQHQQNLMEASLLIQSRWRARSVLLGEDLKMRREGARKVKEAKEAQERKERAAAASIIQAAVRALNVRRKLRAAVSAARYDSDEDSFKFEDEDEDGGDIMAGLKNVEAFLEAEEPTFKAAAAAALSSHTHHHHPHPHHHHTSTLPPLNIPKGPLGLTPLSPPPAPAPPSHHLTADAMSHMMTSNGKTHERHGHGSVQVWVETHPGPASPTLSNMQDATAHQDATSPAYSLQSNVHQTGAWDANKGAFDRGEGNDAALKQQRHIEKLQALMKEWGFKDLATAEAYYRRQKRQTKVQMQSKMEAKLKDPNARLKRLQDQVATQQPSHHMRGGGGEDDKSSLQSLPHSSQTLLAVKQGTVQGPPSRQNSLPQGPHHHHPSSSGHGAMTSSNTNRPPLPLSLASPSTGRQGQGGSVYGSQLHPTLHNQRQVSSAESLTPPTQPIASSFGRSPSFEASPSGGAGGGINVRSSSLFPPLQPSPNRSTGQPSSSNAAFGPSSSSLTRTSAGPMLGGGGAGSGHRGLTGHKGFSRGDDDRSDSGSLRSAVSEGPSVGLATTSAMQQHRLMGGLSHASPTKGKILLPSMGGGSNSVEGPSAPSVNRWMASPDPQNGHQK